MNTTVKQLVNNMQKLQNNLTSLMTSSLVNAAMLECKLRDVIKEVRDGGIRWRIADYPTKQAMAIKGTDPFIQSDVFFATLTNYKMYLICYPNGHGVGEGSYLSLYVKVTKSDFDAIMPWPIKGKISLTMHNKDSSRNITGTFATERTADSFSRPTESNNSPYGYIKFIALSELSDGGGFMIDGNVFITCRVSLD